MTVPVHGEVTVRWHGRICLSILDGAFNEEGIARWFELVKQSWQQQGEPDDWAHVLNMHGWQGRTAGCDALMREAVAWTKAHGLRLRIMMLDKGAASVFFMFTQSSNSIFSENREVTVVVCQNYDEVFDELQKRGFAITLQQLEQPQQR